MPAPPPITILSWLPLLPPLAFGLIVMAAATNPGRHPRRVLAVLSPASAIALLASIGAALHVALVGDVQTPYVGTGPLVASLRLDVLSATMLLLVTVLGSVVLRFSRHYLDGDARHGRFLGLVALATASASLLVLAGTLPLLLGLWVATSLALHSLLRFYSTRPGALRAARKKFVVSRVGDVLLGAACVLLAAAFDTVDIGILSTRARALLDSGAAVPMSVHAAGALLALAAVLKAAQFPVHGWLIEVMEAPTPVSALLHAGLLNAGPFVVVRFAPILLLAAPARVALLAIGLVTAVTASLSMITQTRIKTALAYSSAAHMGFSLVLSGLGLFPLALAHLCAHSCYKAYAFLTSGSVVDHARNGMIPVPARSPGLVTLLGSLALAAAIVGGIAVLFGGAALADPALLFVSVVLVLGLMPMLAQGGAASSSSRLTQVVGIASLAALAFFALESLAARAPDAVLPLVPVRDVPSLTLMTLAVLAFASVVILQLHLPRVGTHGMWARLYLRARNGWYANARFDALLAPALRAPAPLPSSELRA